MKKIFGSSVHVVGSYASALFVFAASAFPVYANDTFPSVDPTTQKTRDDTRRQVLQTELATEKKAADGAQQALSDAANLKQPAGKLDALREEVGRHAKNVDALNGELAALGKLPVAAKATTPVRLTGRTINSSAETTQPAPFWDVYKRAQVKTDDEAKSQAPSSGTPGVSGKQQTIMTK